LLSDRHIPCLWWPRLTFKCFQHHLRSCFSLRETEIDKIKASSWANPWGSPNRSKHIPMISRE
jgi:hypothetical protein